MSYRTLTSGSILVLALCSVVFAYPGNIITFDAPGAGTGFRQGTTATGINAAGATTGYYVDSANFTHGFVRSPGGEFTEFDAGGSTETLANGINDAGAVTGYYIDTYGLPHGFVRSPSGVVTTFDAPPASSSGTYAFAINNAGAIAGFYFEDAVAYSFLRSPSGAFTTFGVPRAGGAGLNGTRANSINNSNAVAGSWTYSDVYTIPNHVFLRTPQGFIESFSAPGAGSGEFQGTLQYGLNDAGAVTGTYIDAKGATYGFVRSSSGGVFTTIIVPGDAAASALPLSINDSGAITGSFSVPAGLSHGFVRSPSGVFTPFDVPGAGGAAYTGTFPGSINQAGGIAGYFIDANSTNHGFLRTP